MNTQIFRSINRPDQKDLTWHERWSGPDKGLITCWEVGRRKRLSDPGLAEKAEMNELPVLGWKGGVEKKLNKNSKYGTLYYLALWQGLRGEDLDIDLDEEKELICSRTGMTVVYTSEASKYSQ